MASPAWQHLMKERLAWQSGTPPRQSLEKCACLWQLLSTKASQKKVCVRERWKDGRAALCRWGRGRGWGYDLAREWPEMPWWNITMSQWRQQNTIHREHEVSSTRAD